MLLDGKYTVAEELQRKSWVVAFRVRAPEGREGLLYWFEVHTPEARSAFFRYRNALKRLEEQGLLVGGVEISAKPGRYYVFWPDVEAPALRRGRPEVAQLLAPFGYGLPDATLVDLKGPKVADLRPWGESATPLKAPRPRRKRQLAAWLPGLILMLGGLLALGGALAIYLNPPIYTLPQLVGLSTAQALQKLRGLDLQLQLTQGSDPSQPTGVILAQSPSAGSQVRPGRLVSLVLNEPRLGSVPQLLGQGLLSAERTLERDGYTTGVVAQAYSSAPVGTVIASLPLAGTPLPAGHSVDLLLSMGAAPPRETEVPPLVGDNLAEARFLLNVADLQPEVLRVVSTAPQDQVLAQNSAPATLLARGATVQLVVAEQPPAHLPSGSPLMPTPTSAAQEVPLDLSLPAGFAQGAQVELVVEDGSGKRTLFAGPAAPGWQFHETIPVQGSATFFWYLNGQLYREWSP
jgi:beta-lactam-binding protein with PASTA domain